MRPVSLRVRGLHSFREPQALDFSELTRAGIFGVFGPTGAGKSTLLDAITLALYGQVDRASRGTRGILNQLEESVEVAFAFELNGAEGVRRYRVERRYARVRDSPASVRSAACRLVEAAAGGGERVLADTPREVTEAVVALLGLTADDFARAVVLPQGKFAEFLHLAGAERRSMLQRLFGLERYGDQLAERIRRELDGVEPELRAVEGEQAGLGDASETALTGARQALDAARAAAGAADSRLAAARAAWETWNQVWAWQGEMQALAVREAEHARQGDAARAAREELETARRAEAVRPHIEAWESAQGQVKQIEERLPRLAAEREDADAARRRAEADRDLARERRQAEGPALQRRRAELEQAVEIEAELEPLREARERAGAALAAAEVAFADAEGAYRQADRDLQALQGEQRRDTELLQRLAIEPERRERARQALDALGAYRQALDARQRCAADLAEARDVQARAAGAARVAAQARAGIEEAHRAAAAAREEWENAPHERGEDLTEAARAVERHRGAIEAYLASVRHRDEARTEHERAERDLRAAADACEAAGAARRTAVQGVRQAEEEREQARSALREAEVEAHAAALAPALEPGKPCPVCGSLDHPAPVAGEPSAAIREAADRLAAAEERLRQAQSALTDAQVAEEAARARREGAENRRDAAAERLSAADADVCKAAAALPEPWRGEPGVPPAEAALVAHLESEERSLKERRAALSGWTGELEARRAREEAELKRLLEAQRKAGDLQAEASRAAGVVGSREAALRDAEAAAREAARRLADRRGGMTDEDVEEEERAIARADAEAQVVSVRLSDRGGAIEAAEGARQVAEARRAEAQEARESSRRRVDEVQGQADRLEGRLRQLTAGAPARQSLEEVDRRLRDLDEAERRAQGALDAAAERLREAAVADESARKQLDEARRRSGDARTRLAAEVRRRGFPSHEAARAALRTAAEQDALEGALRRHEEEAARLRAEREHLEGLLQGRTLDEAAWRSHRETLDRAEEGREAAQKAVGAAERDLAGLEARRVRWEELEGRRAELRRRHDDLAELQSVLRGAAFVEFLAEEQLCAVAREASGRLSRLTRGRYALEVEPHEGFAIRDDHNGGIRRPVSSLSGGETFLASLALALALSAQVQLRGRYPLEFFFLDEGFGSLDPQALDTAIDALERLHEENLVIGVVSHLPEIRARMPRRVIVQPAEPGGAGSRLRIEVA